MGALKPDSSDPSGLSAGDATSAAVSSFLLFALGALVPARSAVVSGLRQVAIGAAAAAVTYLAGRAFGMLPIYPCVRMGQTVQVRIGPHRLEA